MIFKNVNIRQIIGPELFEKHEYFNICLIHMMSSANTYGTNTEDKLLRMEIAGLPWVNNSFVVDKNYNNAHAILSTIKLASTAEYTNFSYSNVATFRKSDNIINLQIRFKRYTGEEPVTTDLFPKIDLYFKIYPVI